MRSVLLGVGLILVLVSLLGSALVAVAYFSVQERIVASIADVPETPVGLVLGASVRPNKKPSGVLQDRIDAGVALLRAGRVRKLLLSGDNRESHYNEVAAMQRESLAQGAPPDKLVLDNAGYRTYDSCFRARDVYDVKSLVIITQRFHLSRALYICRKLGLDAWGIAADGPNYTPSLKLHLREFAAWVLALADVGLGETSEVLGPKEPIEDAPASKPIEP
jgi:SanA protein